MNTRPFLPRFLTLWLILSLALPNPAYALRPASPAQSGAEEQLRAELRSTLSAGAEEAPFPPEEPPDFGRGEYSVTGIGGKMDYRLKPGDAILPHGVTYHSSFGGKLDPMKMGPGVEIEVRKIQTLAVPLNQLGRFSVGGLTFQIVPMGSDQRIGPAEESSQGGVAVAPMAKQYLLQVWLDNNWLDLDMVHLEEDVPVVIGREDLPAELDGITQVDLEGKLGSAVNDQRFDRVFKGWYQIKRSDPEWRVAVSWPENELQKRVYLPRQALSNSISRGDARVEHRPGWSANNSKFVPAYRQTGHVQVEIMGDEVVFSGLGSTNPTRIEVNSRWAGSQGHRVHQEHVSIGPNLWDEADASEANSRSFLGSSAAQDPALADEVVADLAGKKNNQLIVIEKLSKEPVPVNPEKLAQFQFDKPFAVFFMIRGQPKVPTVFRVHNGQLEVQKETWRPVGYKYSAQEYVEVAGQSGLGEEASQVPEGYQVYYSPSKNTVLVLNHSPYQINIAQAAGAEENLNAVISEQLAALLAEILSLPAAEAKQKAEQLLKAAPFQDWSQFRSKAKGTLEKEQITKLKESGRLTISRAVKAQTSAPSAAPVFSSKPVLRPLEQPVRIVRGLHDQEGLPWHLEKMRGFLEGVEVERQIVYWVEALGGNMALTQVFERAPAELRQSVETAFSRGDKSVSFLERYRSNYQQAQRKLAEPATAELVLASETEGFSAGLMGEVRSLRAQKRKVVILTQPEPFEAAVAELRHQVLSRLAMDALLERGDKVEARRLLAMSMGASREGDGYRNRALAAELARHASNHPVDLQLVTIGESHEIGSLLSGKVGFREERMGANLPVSARYVMDDIQDPGSAAALRFAEREFLSRSVRAYLMSLQQDHGLLSASQSLALIHSWYGVSNRIPEPLVSAWYQQAEPEIPGDFDSLGLATLRWVFRESEQLAAVGQPYFEFVQLFSGAVNRAGAEEGSGLSHGPDFIFEAKQAMSSEEIKPDWGQTYVLQPGTKMHARFVRYLAEELRRLPFDAEVGEPILIREDARAVASRLADHLEKRLGSPQWDKDTTAIADIFQGLLQVFSYRIYPRDNVDGVGYNLDLSANLSEDMKQTPHGIVLNRYWVTRAAGFQVLEHGIFKLQLQTGHLELDLGVGPVSNPRLVPTSPEQVVSSWSGMDIQDLIEEMNRYQPWGYNYYDGSEEEGHYQTGESRLPFVRRKAWPGLNTLLKQIQMTERTVFDLTIRRGGQGVPGDRVFAVIIGRPPKLPAQPAFAGAEEDSRDILRLPSNTDQRTVEQIGRYANLFPFHLHYPDLSSLQEFYHATGLIQAVSESSAFDQAQAPTLLQQSGSPVLGRIADDLRSPDKLRFHLLSLLQRMESAGVMFPSEEKALRDKVGSLFEAVRAGQGVSESAQAILSFPIETSRWKPRKTGWLEVPAGDPALVGAAKAVLFSSEGFMDLGFPLERRTKDFPFGSLILERVSDIGWRFGDATGSVLLQGQGSAVWYEKKGDITIWINPSGTALKVRTAEGEYPLVTFEEHRELVFSLSSTPAGAEENFSGYYAKSLAKRLELPLRQLREDGSLSFTFDSAAPDEGNWVFAGGVPLLHLHAAPGNGLLVVPEVQAGRVTGIRNVLAEPVREQVAGIFWEASLAGYDAGKERRYYVDLRTALAKHPEELQFFMQQLRRFLFDGESLRRVLQDNLAKAVRKERDPFGGLWVTDRPGWDGIFYQQADDSPPEGFRELRGEELLQRLPAAAGAEEAQWPGYISPPGVAALARLMSKTIKGFTQRGEKLTQQSFIRVADSARKFDPIQAALLSQRELDVDRLDYFFNRLPAIVGVGDTHADYPDRLQLVIASMESLASLWRKQNFPLGETRENQAAVVLSGIQAQTPVAESDRKDITGRLLEVLLTSPAAAGAEEYFKTDEALTEIQALAAKDRRLTEVHIQVPGFPADVKSLAGVPDWEDIRIRISVTGFFSNPQGSVKVYIPEASPNAIRVESIDQDRDVKPDQILFGPSASPQDPAAGAEENAALIKELQAVQAVLKRIIGSLPATRARLRVPFRDALTSIEADLGYLRNGRAATAADKEAERMGRIGVDLAGAWTLIHERRKQIDSTLLEEADLNRLLHYFGAKDWREAVRLLNADGTAKTAKARAAAANMHPVLEHWINRQYSAIAAVTLGQQETFDLKTYYPPAVAPLTELVFEAGYPEGRVLVVPAPRLASAPLPQRVWTVYVEDEPGWRDAVASSLSGGVRQEKIRFEVDPAKADIVIARNRSEVPLRPDQVFIGANDATIGRVTLGLLDELRQQGLLRAGSVVMLYSSPAESVLIFA